MDKAILLAEFKKQLDFMKEDLFSDKVLIAIIRVLDYDIAKELDPETADEPEMIPALLDEMRTAAIETMWEHIMEVAGIEDTDESA